jgi:replication-associated recombination protein RarA
METYPYDPWQKCKTISGLAADEVISALQKEIRRNHPENAAVLAYEMLLTSEDMEEYLWYRLRTISVEDIGMANPIAPILIASLDQMRRQAGKHDGDRRLLAIHAVRYLCQSQKDRSSDEMLNWIIKEYDAGTLRPQIPPYALDKHTLAGQKKGMGEQYFYDEASKVSPEWEERDKTYRNRILRILAESKKADA